MYQLFKYYQDYSGVLVVISVLYLMKFMYDEEINLNKNNLAIIVITYFVLDLIFRKYWRGYKGIELSIIFPLVIIFFNRKRKRIRGILLVIMSFLTLTIPLSIIVLVFSIIMNEKILNFENNVYLNFFIDLITFSVVIYICYVKEKYKSYFTLNTWEKIIIWTTSLLGIITMFSIEEFQQKNIFTGYGKVLEVAIVCIIILLVISMIISIVKNKSTSYYKYLAEINEHYMQTELNHFQSYKLSQQKTRKIKHDMKNHMICIHELCKMKKYDKLNNYIENLQNTVNDIDKQIFTGNDIVDAIINEKILIAEEKNISINIDGRFDILNNIAPTDICTVISNAIDNAIEGSDRCEALDKKYINIKSRVDRNYIIIEIVNLVDKYITIENNKIKSSKNDDANHGFGLENIKNVLKKYNGDLILTCNEIGKNHLYEFKLEMIMLN